MHNIIVPSLKVEGNYVNYPDFAFPDINYIEVII